MDAEERERFYDREIAPVLLALGEKCQANGLSLLAMCEWAPFEVGRTEYTVKDAGVSVVLTRAAMRARGNYDTLSIAMMKYAKQHGHQSVFLELMGRD